MKKFLAICSVILSVCATFTACGSADKSDTSNHEKSAVTDDKKDSRTENDKDMGDRIDDAVDGAGRAGNDLIGGATDAIDDVIDGIDGNDDDDDNNNSKRSSRTTDKKSR